MEKKPLSRRDFLSGLAALAVFAASGAARSAAADPAATPRKRGGTRINVRDHGARGDGAGDDTTSFQAAIDALPDDGGTVFVPAGIYVIDPTRSVKLRSRMLLSLADGAKLLAKANAAPRSYVLLGEQLQDVEISGGSIVGDRDSHLGTSGEWGHGIRLSGCVGASIRNIHVSRCWGDGISAGGNMLKGSASRPGRDLLIANVVCTGNRRQGLTLGSYRGARVLDSVFSDTGGTPPAAGIDIEPDTDVARDIAIERCVLRGNRGPGIQLYKRTAGITIANCIIERNRGDGILGLAAVDSVFSQNVIRNNGAKGVTLRAGSRNVRLIGNEFKGNRGDGKAQVKVADDSVSVGVDASNRFE
nr:right-handed parallel beta-helix repeat-containing protein [Luteimonas gilva]